MGIQLIESSLSPSPTSWRYFTEEFGLKLGQVRKHARHRAGGVVLRQPIRAHDTGEAVIGRTGVTVFRPLVSHCCRIVLLVWIKWIAYWSFQSFVVCWQGAVCQSLWGENPARPIGVQDERFIPGESLITLRVFRRLVIRRFRLREVRDVQSRPLFVLLIPPNEFLTLAPGPSI